MPLVGVDDSWEKVGMNSPSNKLRADNAPALYRLLAESALSRAALAGCGVPLALVDSRAKGGPVTYANPAFLRFFGYEDREVIGKPLAALVFRGEDSLVQRMLAESPKRWELSAWAKDGVLLHVEAALAALRDAAGAQTHWVVAFSDRGEIERLRAEVEALKSLAAARLGVRLDPPGEPARSAQQPRVEVAPADELYPERQPGRVL